MIDLPLDFKPSPLAGRKQFDVPWEKAESIQARLAEHGISATAYLEPGERKAAIEVGDSVASEAVLAAIG